jgi:hypothetical protein
VSLVYLISRDITSEAKIYDKLISTSDEPGEEC